MNKLVLQSFATLPLTLVAYLLINYAAQVQAIEGTPLTDEVTAPAKEKISIRVGTIVFPPLVQKDSDGRCHGNSIDNIYRIFQSDVFAVEIYCATPARIYRDFANANVDITLNIKSTDSLADNVYFSKHPTNVLEVILYSKKDSDIRTVSSIYQFNYHGIRDSLVSEGYKMIDQANSKEAITVFIRGGTDALLSYKMPFEYYSAQVLERASFGRIKVEYDEKSLMKVPTYFVVNKSSPYAELIITTIDAKN